MSVDTDDCFHSMPKFLCRVCSAANWVRPPSGLLLERDHKFRSGYADYAEAGATHSGYEEAGAITGSLADVKQRVPRYISKQI
ncbi:MAG: hypothetical protein ACREMY_34025 [bacterium]